MSDNNLSFDELMDLPLADSSPLKSPISGPIIPDLQESPSPLSGNVVSARRKRPAEDMSQFAGEVARAHKLPKAEHDELATYSKMGRAEQSIAMMGHIFALKRQQNLIIPADAAWAVPKRLHSKISEHAAILIADSSIPAYRNDKIGPSKLLMDMVLANPDWGFGLHLKSEKDAMDTLSSEVSLVLTAKRNTIKTVVISSLGSSPPEGSEQRTDALNIVELSHLLISKLKVRVKVDIRLCGRVAILRKLIAEKNDNTYWGAVDRQLANVRKKHPDPVKQSKWIKQHMLDPDLALYKHVELKDLASGPGVPFVPMAGPSRLPDASDDE
ncbi:hypothetical protein DFH08DRAFT_965771 [Mycena albidolilacea]|uniref:Uncharacterized protein n=1 Tax=Mycena albidolilacea TaxID=1033008 RepID=A0AAD6ZQJ8_9AGAR|nr:hypothetical protein DFH08DRAFT_965771 [Mycena albidolilacea]